MSYFFFFSKQFYHVNILYNEHIFSIIKIYKYKKMEKVIMANSSVLGIFVLYLLLMTFFLQNEKHKVLGWPKSSLSFFHMMALVMLSCF